jgi:hypothetical protein
MERRAIRFDVAPAAGRAVVAGFDGAATASDAGASLVGSFAACFTDARAPERIEHRVAATLVGQRVFGIALGDEDLIDLGEPGAEGFVRKLGHIDLLAVRDPEGVARQRGDRPADAPRDRFGFPFFTIESVAAVDADNIIVANDNSLPFSAGRHLARADDNEFILLRGPEFRRAR